MGAVHEESLANKTKRVEEREREIFKELQKLQTTQLPVPMTLVQVSGKGRGGIGTVFPIHEPIEDLGIVNTSPITLDLSSAKVHYIRMSIEDITDLVINLRELVQGKAIRFVLDISLNVSAFNSITFDPAISNVPDFDKTLGSRFLLEIQGVKVNATDERYEVLNAGTGGGVGGIIITPTLENTNPSASENVDLSLFQHFIFQLDANITITLINPPINLNRAEQFVLEFIQDGVGGRTLSVTNTIHPSVPALDGTALSRTVIVGFVVNDIGGNKRFDMYLVGS